MDYQSLRNVLGILRLLKSNSNTAASDTIRKWIGGPLASEASILKVAMYIQEQVADALISIENSQLSQEAREGLQSTLNGLRVGFSIKNLNANPLSTVQNVSAAISNFVILLDVSGAKEEPLPQEAADLVAEIAEVMKSFNDPALDPLVRETAKRHLQILSTMLQHIPLFGLEAALATYFELMMKVRRADATASAASKSKLDPIFAKMEKWAQRLGIIDKIWNSGTRLLNHADKTQVLLSYLPS